MEETDAFVLYDIYTSEILDSFVEHIHDSLILEKNNLYTSQQERQYMIDIYYNTLVEHDGFEAGELAKQLIAIVKLEKEQKKIASHNILGRTERH